jgi:hypothetical protein
VARKYLVDTNLVLVTLKPAAPAKAAGGAK